MASPDLPVLLRGALDAADFTYDAVAGLLGPVAHAALGRNETAPGLRRTTEASPLATLVRLFLLQAPVDRGDAERALPDLVEPMCGEGFLEASGGQVRALLDVRPYATDGVDGDLWVVSDLTPGLDGLPNRVGPDHVLGISSASTSLAQLTLREPVGRALDLGTGCGVQALHLARHADQVVATDVNRRALWITRFNAVLNGCDLDVREGSYFDPVADEEFDLVATNPPFVISPATAERLVYRDSGLPGDRVVEDIVRAVPRHLAPGGWGQVLANWAVRRGEPWQDRLAGWVAPAGDRACDTWVVQRELVDPAAYVELWLSDAGATGAERLRRYDEWLGWFEDQRIEAVGFGWINLRRTDREPVTRFEEWPWEVEQPVAGTIADWGRAVDGLRTTGEEDLLRTRLQVREDVQQETVGTPGAEHPEAVVLRQRRGLRRARQVDTVAGAVVGACDGDLALGQILDAVSSLLDRSPGELRSTYPDRVRELVEEGYLHLPPPSTGSTDALL